MKQQANLKSQKPAMNAVKNRQIECNVKEKNLINNDKNSKSSNSNLNNLGLNKTNSGTSSNNKGSKMSIKKKATSVATTINEIKLSAHKNTSLHVSNTNTLENAEIENQIIDNHKKSTPIFNFKDNKKFNSEIKIYENQKRSFPNFPVFFVNSFFYLHCMPGHQPGIFLFIHGGICINLHITTHPLF